MSVDTYRTRAELEAGLEYIRQSPRDNGVVQLIVCRPRKNVREVLTEAELDVVRGLVGDNWLDRGSTDMADGSAHPGMQLNLMNSRAIELVAQQQDRWPLAGDQIYIDLELSDENLPPGSQLEIGTAVIEVTDVPHNGCRKFSARFGTDATKFVNSREGKRLHLRGINARIITPGTIHAGDVAKVLRRGP